MLDYNKVISGVMHGTSRPMNDKRSKNGSVGPRPLSNKTMKEIQEKLKKNGKLSKKDLDKIHEEQYSDYFERQMQEEMGNPPDD